VSELSRFVKDRNVDNVINAEVVSIFADNPALAEVNIPGSGVVTLIAADGVELRVGLPVMVAKPGGDLRRAYIKGKAAVIVGEQTFNKVLGLGAG
jgi:hypothetical protein